MAGETDKLEGSRQALDGILIHASCYFRRSSSRQNSFLLEKRCHTIESIEGQGFYSRSRHWADGKRPQTPLHCGSLLAALLSTRWTDQVHRHASPSHQTHVPPSCSPMMDRGHPPRPCNTAGATPRSLSFRPRDPSSSQPPTHTKKSHICPHSSHIKLPAPSTASPPWLIRRGGGASSSSPLLVEASLCR